VPTLFCTEQLHATHTTQGEQTRLSANCSHHVATSFAKARSFVFLHTTKHALTHSYDASQRPHTAQTAPKTSFKPRQRLSERTKQNADGMRAWLHMSLGCTRATSACAIDGTAGRRPTNKDKGGPAKPLGGEETAGEAR
jgi:hypothetical protein